MTEEKSLDFLRKHHSVVEMTNKLSLLQRKAWNVLIANAFSDLKNKSKYTISARDLCTLLGYNSNDWFYLADELKKIQTTIYSVRILEGEGQYAANISILGDNEIGDGKCTYSLGDKIREILTDPGIYARINIRVQRELTSKHTLALYELCKTYYNETDKGGTSPYIDLPTLKKLLLGEEDLYQTFKLFNQMVLKKAIMEVNSKTEIHVACTFKKERNKVVAVQFIITKNHKQLDLLIESPEKPELSAVAQELKNRGVSFPRALELVKDYGEEKCIQQIEHYDYLLDEAEEGRLDKDKAPKSGAWLVSAIEDSYQPPKGFRPKALREKEKHLKELRKEIRDLRAKGDFDALELILGQYESVGGTGIDVLKAEIEKAKEAKKLHAQIMEIMENPTPDQRQKVEAHLNAKIKANPYLSSITSDKNSHIYKGFVMEAIKELFIKGT